MRTTREQIVEQLEARLRFALRRGVDALTEEQRARCLALLTPVQHTLHRLITLTVEELMGDDPGQTAGKKTRSAS